EEWRTTFDAIEEGVCLLDRDGAVRRANRAFGSLFGPPVDELIGVDCRTLFGPECRGFDVMLETGSRQTDEIRVDSRIFEIGFSPIHAPNGGLDGGVCSVRDVTVLRKAKEERDRLLAAEQAARAEAEAASRIKDDFLAAVSHDLRGPLQSILIWAELLRDPNLSEASRLRTVESLDRSAHAQRRLIDDLLDMSRIISGRLKVSLSQCDVRSILLLTMETVRPTAEARGVALEVDLDPAGAPALCDPDRLQQVFWNLLANAVKFTPKGGRVQVRLERAGELMRIRVSDNGEGIDPSFLPHVFDHFRQGDNAPGGRNAGLGLGLSIARRLVELHGGTIEAESPGKGQGSVFTVTLPLNPDLRRSARDASSPARS
ncbi:MAG TPA: PAS domain-containing sensor histidine kinase, partial [Arenibaculum sp.]|nr:PAS domain-containing sensor histidine kinase [Arenibaculum sp.]